MEEKDFTVGIDKPTDETANNPTTPVVTNVTVSVPNSQQQPQQSPQPFTPQFSPTYFKEKDESASPAIVDKTAELVTDVLHAGIIHKVKTDADVKNRILETADKIIDTNLSVAESKAEKADKEAFFDSNRDACSYFGFDEKTTAKTHVGMMKGWAWVFNTLYILTVGFFVVAPIIFICHKLRVAIKQAWLVVVLAIVIYALIVLTPFVVVWLGRV